MNLEDARAILLSQPDAVEGSHHGHPDFRVGKSIFATLRPEKDRSVLRLPLPVAEALESDHPGLYSVVSRTGRAGWLAVKLPLARAEEFRSLAEMARDYLKARS